MVTSRRDFLKYLGVAAAAAPLPHWLADKAYAGGDRPNIVVILSDDHRHDVMSCAGHPFVKTPSLDRLAAGGVRFTDACTTTSLCSPSRASFLTGRYAHTHRITGNLRRDLPPGTVTYPSLLHAAGYETAYIGKWHLGQGKKRRPDFDHWFSFAGQGQFENNSYSLDADIDIEDAGYVTDVLTERALAFLNAPHEQPFLMILSHKAVHAPFTPAERHTELYPDADTDMYWAPDEDVAAKPSWPGNTNYADMRDQVPDYFRCLAALDESVGAVDEALSAAELAENTIVVYTSDNGFLLGEHAGMWDKRSSYEPSLRIPLIVRWPNGLSGGRTDASLALNIDLMPSLLAAAGVAVPDEVQGRSWWPVLDGEAGRDATLHEYFQHDGDVESHLAVRTRSWKYIEPITARGWRNPKQPLELYDLMNDPGELVNLATDPSYAETLTEMQAEQERLKTETGFTTGRRRR